MILAFNPQFVPGILNGTKIHAIRLDPTLRWKPGVKIHFIPRVRAKNYKQFKEGICTSTQTIKIYGHGNRALGYAIYVDDRELEIDEIVYLAWNDGFKNLADFRAWFSEDFQGILIHWTDKKY